MFDEQVAWAADAGVDYIIGETFSWLGEALIALAAIRATGLPAVMTLAITRNGLSWDERTPEDCCQALEQGGADVVGLNCSRGPATMLPLLEPIRRAVACPVAALPVPYRTDAAHPTFQSLSDPGCHCIPDNRPFPTALDPFTCNRYEMAEFAAAAQALGVAYIGGCCGTGPHHLRAMAEALGKRPAASRYSPDMSRHAYYGTDAAIPKRYRERGERW
jgi:betaine-homocysteine S-methyltransferase